MPGPNLIVFDLVGRIVTLVDSLVSNRKERDELKSKITEVVGEYEQTVSKELTKRLEIDSGGTKLARNIRPLTLIYLTILISILAFTDGNLGVITVKEIYVTKFIDAWWMAVLFYFGSRGVEKVFQVIKKAK